MLHLPFSATLFALTAMATAPSILNGCAYDVYIVDGNTTTTTLPGNGAFGTYYGVPYDASNVSSYHSSITVGQNQNPFTAGLQFGVGGQSAETIEYSIEVSDATQFGGVWTAHPQGGGCTDVVPSNAGPYDLPNNYTCGTDIEVVLFLCLSE